MEYHSIAELIIGTIMAVFGWLMREMWNAVKELKEDLGNLRVQIPENYVNKTDFRNDMQDIKEMLSKIFDKLDNKADK